MILLWRCLKTPNAYVQVVKWNGKVRDWTSLKKHTGAQYGVKDGDLVEATIIGNVIKGYVNGVGVISVTVEGHQAMASINREQVAADWAKRGFGCDLWIDTPGQRWEDFTHATDELVLVLEGEMEVEVAGRVCHPKIGEEILIPAGAIHSARNVGATTARWLYGYKR